jgi:hypothetical protein
LILDEKIAIRAKKSGPGREVKPAGFFVDLTTAGARAVSR